MASIFKGKTVWVIGASSGIGKELAIQLANNGSKVILSARNVEALEELKTNLKTRELHVVYPLNHRKSSG